MIDQSLFLGVHLKKLLLAGLWKKNYLKERGGMK